MMTSERRSKPRGYSYDLVRRIRSADPMHIGVKLGCLCIDKNIPVTEVAKDLRVSRLTIYSWFTGTYYPRPEKMADVQELLIRYGLR